VSKSPPAEIPSFIIARKGGPVPVHAQPDASTLTAMELVNAPGSAPVTATAPRPPRAPLIGTIAVTVRLDPMRYERLKTMAGEQRETNQAILVAALDAYMRQQGRT